MKPSYHITAEQAGPSLADIASWPLSLHQVHARLRPWFARHFAKSSCGSDMIEASTSYRSRIPTETTSTSTLLVISLPTKLDQFCLPMLAATLPRTKCTPVFLPRLHSPQTLNWPCAWC